MNKKLYYDGYYKKIISKELHIASSPFIHQQKNNINIMLMVVFACIPGLLALTYFFGYGSLIQTLLAIITALLAEVAVIYLRTQGAIKHLKDNSALLTGVLLGISLPPLAPWWIVVWGTLFAIVIAKQLYGGLGQNIFNPAMVGYVVLLISFPVHMTCWLSSIELQTTPINFIDSLRVIFTDYSYQDGVTKPTPLDILKTELRHKPIAFMLQQPLFGGVPSSLGWQWVNVGFLFGGMFLWWRKIIQLYIPFSFLLALFCCATLSYLIAPNSFPSPLFHLFSGATMFGAFFIATDPVSAPTTPLGHFIFGMLIGILVWLIRSYSDYPDGVAFAILLGNITVPIIDHYSQLRIYGQ